MLKLYHGGCGTATGYIVAENERKAIQDLSHKLGIPYLPVEVQEIEVEGYEITVTVKKGTKCDEEAVDSSVAEEPVPTELIGEEGGEVVEPDTEHGGEGEGIPRAEGTNKVDGRKGGTRKKSDQ